MKKQIEVYEGDLSCEYYSGRDEVIKLFTISSARDDDRVDDVLMSFRDKKIRLTIEVIE